MLGFVEFALDGVSIRRGNVGVGIGFSITITKAKAITMTMTGILIDVGTNL